MAGFNEGGLIPPGDGKAESSFPGTVDMQSVVSAKTPTSVPDMLRAAAQIYEQRNTLYGNNYKEFGKWVDVLFPDGVELNSAEDWNRLGVLVQILSKLGRYAQQFAAGGHKDSLDDLVVYAMMLQELDMEASNA